MRSEAQYALPRVSRWLAVLLMSFVLLPTSAEAGCNLIPIAEKQHPSTLGGVTDPITAPGRTVEIVVTPCDVSAGFEPVATDNDVELRFEPPGLGTDTVVAPNPATIAVADCILPGGRCRRLTFETPDTTSLLPPHGLAGPARVTVRDLGNVTVAEIGTLFLPTFECDRQPETTFQQFTVLPVPNSFADAAQGTLTELRATVDGGGDLLVPFDYWGGGANSVLAETPGAPVAILLKGSTDLPAQGAGDDQSILEVVGAQDEPSKFVRSFTLKGRPLPPLLRLTETGELIGASDAVESVLRLARNDGKGGKDLYDLSDRLFMDRGPILITGFSTERKSPIPLKSIQASGNTVAFAREESREGVDLNGDLDQTDRVMEIVDSGTGQSLNTAQAVVSAPLLQGQFDSFTADQISEPAAVSSGDLVAFLEYERDQNVDRNGDGDEDDSFLRVYRRDGTNLTAANDTIEAAPVALVDGKPLAISGRRVFFRTPNSFVQSFASMTDMVDVAVSPDGKHLYAAGLLAGIGAFSIDQTTGRLTLVDTQNDGGVGRAITVSPDGKNVYLTKDDGIHVYTRDDTTGEVDLLETHTEGVGGETGLASANDQAVSSDGKNVYVVTGTGTVVVYGRNLVTGALTFVESEPAGLDFNSHVVVSSDGKHVYAVREAYDRSAVDGSLTFLGPAVPLGSQIALSPDGTRFFLALPNGLTSATRDANTGMITPTSASCNRYDTFNGYVSCNGFSDGIGEAPTTDLADGLVVSADGSRLYGRGRSEAVHVNAYTLNQTNGRATFVGSYLDGAAGVHGLVQKGGVALSPNGKFLYVASDIDQAITVFRNDLRLAVFDTETQTLMAHQPLATTVSVAGERALFLTNEGLSGEDLNGDGDTADEVAQLYDASGKNDEVIPLAIAANAVALSDQVGALLVPEANENDGDLSGDGDTDDDAVFYLDLANPQIANGSLSGKRIAVSGDKIIVAGHEANDFFGDDVNHDGDTDDIALWVFSPTDFEGDVPPISIRSFAVNGPVVALLSYEQDDGMSDLNGDGDEQDLVMHFYRLDTRELFNTRQEGEGCNLPGICPPLTPFKVDLQKQTVSFLQDQSMQGTSGDSQSLVLQVFSIRSGTGQVLSQLVSDDGSLADQKLPPFPIPFLGDDVVFRPIRENDPGLNQDVNDDGLVDGTVVVIVQGDADGDGTIDDYDTCTEASNPDALDVDADGLGDSACDPDPSGCPATPLTTCRTAPSGKSSIAIKNVADDAKDSVKWKWGKGVATTITDIGDPVGGQAHYSLCVYDGSGAPQPIVDAAAAAQASCGTKSCWKSQGSKGVSYKEKTGRSGGTTQVKLGAGAGGKAKADFQGKGALLALPPLPATLPVTVQLIVKEGVRQDCWTATYSTSTSNDAAKGFKAKSD